MYIITSSIHYQNDAFYQNIINNKMKNNIKNNKGNKGRNKYKK